MNFWQRKLSMLFSRSFMFFNFSNKRRLRRLSDQVHDFGYQGMSASRMQTHAHRLTTVLSARNAC
jgi:hypothetical protein